MVNSLFKLTFKTVAQQILLDLVANPGSWQTQNGYFVRNPLGPLAGVAAMPFWVVVRNPTAGAPAIATIPTLGPTALPTLVICPEIMVFVPGPPLGGHNPDQVVFQNTALLGLPLATRQNNVVGGWTHSSFDGITQ